MRISKTIFSLALIFTLPVLASEQLATIMSTPTNTEFVNRILKRRVPIQPAEGTSDGSVLATEIYSILARRNVKSIAAYEVWGRDGITSAAKLEMAFARAAAEGIPVVFNIFGAGNNNAVCQKMAAYPNVAFVTVSGASGENRNTAAEPACGAPNILITSTYDQISQCPFKHYNYGGFVRIAGPGRKIEVTHSDGQSAFVSNQSAAASFVAARLANFAMRHPYERGGQLISDFLAQNTLRIPALDDKIQGGRVLNDSGQ